MKLRFPAAPAAAHRAMEDALQSFALDDPAGGEATLYLGLKDEERVQLPFYMLQYPDAGSLPALRELSPSGWAFMVRTSVTKALPSDFSLAHIAEREGSYRFTHMQHGWIPELMLAMLGAVRSGAWARKGTYSPALLHHFGLRRVALWYRSEDPKMDCIVPLLRSTLARGQGAVADPPARSVTRFFREAEENRKRQRQSAFDNSPLNPGPMPERFNLHRSE